MVGMIRAAALAAVAAVAVAAELTRADLIVAAEMLPAALDYVVTASDGSSRGGSDNLDRAVGLRLGGRWIWSRPGAAVAPQFGLDVVAEEADYAGSMSLSTFGLAVAVGAAWAPADAWLVEAEAYALAGRTTAEADGRVEMPAYSASGRCEGYGVRAGVARNLSRRWLAGLTLGWRSTSAALSGDPIDLTLDSAGAVFGVTLAWRHNLRPPAID